MTIISDLHNVESHARTGGPDDEPGLGITLLIFVIVFLIIAILAVLDKV